MGTVTGLFKLTEEDIVVTMELAYEKMRALRDRKGNLSSEELTLFVGSSNLIVSLLKQCQERDIPFSDMLDRVMERAETSV